MTATEVLPLGGEDEIMIFFRDGMFYPVQGCLGRDLALQAADHAALNPGTLRVEDVNGKVLWQLQ